MRPNTIVGFEVIFFATLILGIFQSYLGWEENTQLLSQALVLCILILTFTIIIALVLFISRKRSKIAMWILIILTLLGLPLLYSQFTTGQLAGSGWITLIQTLAQLFAIALLFLPASREWLNKKAE